MDELHIQLIWYVKMGRRANVVYVNTVTYSAGMTRMNFVMEITNVGHMPLPSLWLIARKTKL